MPRERQPRQWKKTQVLPKRTNQLHKDVVEDVDASLECSALHGWVQRWTAGVLTSSFQAKHATRFGFYTYSVLIFNRCFLRWDIGLSIVKENLLYPNFVLSVLTKDGFTHKRGLWIWPSQSPTLLDLGTTSMLRAHWLTDADKRNNIRIIILYRMTRTFLNTRLVDFSSIPGPSWMYCPGEVSPFVSRSTVMTQYSAVLLVP